MGKAFSWNFRVIQCDFNIQADLGFDSASSISSRTLGSLAGVRLSFIPFAFSFFAYTSHWWTDTEGSLAAAIEEMPAGYDQQMIPVIDNIPVLIVVLVLTVPTAILAMQLAERTLKKPAATLK